MLILLLVIFCAVSIRKSTFNSADNISCAFCDRVVLDYQKFYEDDLVIALYSHKPIFPGHSLIIPKRHVERFEMLSAEEISGIGEVIKKVNSATMKAFGSSSYLLLQKNGSEVGQSINHLHIHYVPRKEGDRSILKYFLRMLLANVKNPISSEEMRKSVNKMKNELK